MDIIEDYYKAYEKRYKQVYNENSLWSSRENTKDVLNAIETLNLTKNNKILDLGCGEGRDAIILLEKGYNLLAVDYSNTVIKKCNELTNNLYINNFKQLDIITDSLNEKYDFIYSVAVLHMFLTKEHRNKYYSFIYRHLNDKGYALIGTMGNGTENYESNINDSFDNVKRVILNNNKKINVAATSCKIVNWSQLENEIKENNLIITKKWISQEVPEFKNMMFALIKRK